jgi:CRISPR-associated protein Cas5d
MSYGIKLRVWGALASFNRPEMKVERVSYDVITPSAARGILEAIYWKPQIRWVIDRIHVLKPIRFTHVRRNEISSKIPVSGKTGVQAAMKRREGRLGIVVEEHRQQRAGMILRDVCYGIEAHVEVLDPNQRDGTPLDAPEAKHLDAFRRRAEKGQYFQHPYLGSREFPADFELVDAFPVCPDELRGDRDLGLMLHDIVFAPAPTGRIIESSCGERLSAEPRFFRAAMRNGVIDVPVVEEVGGRR